MCYRYNTNQQNNNVKIKKLLTFDSILNFLRIDQKMPLKNKFNRRY